MYCHICGSKLKEDKEFCSNCGERRKEKITKEKVIEKKESKPIDTTKLVLITGVFLVLFASFIFGICSWNNFSEIVKISFFFVECIIFISFSILLKPVEKNISKLFLIIGCILLPYSLSLVPYYKMIPNFFKGEAGLYTYLAICYFIVRYIYLLLSVRYKSILLKVLGYLSFMIGICFTCLIFKLDNSTISLIELLYLSILGIVSHIRKDIVSNIFYIILISLCAPALSIIFGIENNFIIELLIIILYIINIVFVVLNIKNKELGIFFALIEFSILTSYCYFLITNKDYIFICVSIISLVLYIFNSLLKNNYLKYTTLVLSYFCLSFSFIILYFFEYWVNYSLIVVTIAIAIINIYNIFNVSKKFNYFIPASLFLLLYSIIRTYTDIKLLSVCIISVTLFISVYILLKIINSKYSKTYLISALVILFISIYEKNSIDLLNNIIICSLTGYLFIFSILFKENKVYSIISYILLNILVLDSSASMYNGFIIIGLFTSLLCVICDIFLKNKLKGYDIYSLVIILLASLMSSRWHLPIYLLLNILIYILGYIILKRSYNNKPCRIIYTIFGFILINNIIKIIIVPVVLSSIVVILTLLILLIILYLSEMEDKYSITIISFALLIPYYSLIYNCFNDLTNLYLFPFIIYTIIFTEIIEFKNDSTRNAATIIPLAIIIYFSIIFSGINSNHIFFIVYNMILGLVFVVLGILRKQNMYVYIGIFSILGLLLFELFSIMGSIIAIISLIFIGFIFIGIATFIEINKNKQVK